MVSIGLDIGTTTICACVLDAGTGRILQTWTHQHSFLPAVQPYEKQQSISEIVLAVDGILAEIVAHYSDILCLGLTGQMHGIVYLDAQGQAISPLITWQDARGNEPFPGKNCTWAQQLQALTGHPCASGFGAVTHYYNVQNGLVPPNAASFCTIHDYVFLRLCGQTRPVTHPSDAASIGLFDLARGCFDTAAIRAAGLDETLFPDVQSAFTAPTRYGFPAVVAIGDNQACYHGSVRDPEDALLVNVGTGSQISCHASACQTVPGIEARPYLDGAYLLSGSPLCGGRAYALLERFFRTFLQAAGHPVQNTYEILNRLAADYDTLTDPLVTHTTFCGSRQEPDLRGAIGRIGIDNFTPTHLTVSFLQGCVDELHEFYRAMQPLLPHPPQYLVGSGNGLRQNPTLQALFSKTFGLPLRIPAHREEAACGAALFSMICTQPERTPQSIRALIRYEAE